MFNIQRASLALSLLCSIFLPLTSSHAKELLLLTEDAPSHMIASDAQDKEILILTDDGPPHMIKQTDGGIDLDITIEVLQRIGHDVAVFYTPLSRAKKSVEGKLADVTVPTFFQKDSQNFYLSNPVVYYQPTLFSLSSKAIDMSDIKKLTGFRLMTFQGAKGYFNQDFLDMTRRNQYREMHDMSVLPELLFKDRADLVVLDYYIFYYFALERIESFRPDLFEHYPLMDKVPAYAGFHSKALRDKFNKALADYLLEGRDKLIIKKYLGDDIPIDLAKK